jgi:hypothetical protein
MERPPTPSIAAYQTTGASPVFRIVLDDLPGKEGFHDFVELDALRHHLLLRVLRDANLLAGYLLAATRLESSDVIDWQKFTSSPGILTYGSGGCVSGDKCQFRLQASDYRRSAA